MNIYVGRVLSNGTGGEGSVYEVVGNSEFVYKRYKPFKLTDLLERKLMYMVSNPPIFKVTEPPFSNMDKCFSWPVQLMNNTSGKLDGFVMRRLEFNKKLNDVYESTHYPYEFSVVVAKNLCTLVHQIHQNNITIGDFNHGNVGVFETTSAVSMMDCDSFHIGSGKYPCCVCMDGYAAPELLKYMRDILNTTRYEEAPFSQNTDLFSLAVHIFRLLFNGVSPYNGINTTVRTSSDVVSAGNDPIEKGLYVFRQGLSPAHPACPPKYVLPDQLIELFDKAFLNNYDVDKPQSSRPKALEWYNALQKYKSSLMPCRVKDTHQYFNELSCCPWCEAEYREATFNRTRNMNGLPAFKVRRL